MRLFEGKMLILILLLLIALLQRCRLLEVASYVPLLESVSAFELSLGLAQIREHAEDTGGCESH